MEVEKATDSAATTPAECGVTDGSKVKGQDSGSVSQWNGRRSVSSQHCAETTNKESTTSCLYVC